MKACKLCHGVLIKQMVQPFQQAGWVWCSCCNSAGPLMLIADDIDPKEVRRKQGFQYDN